MNEIRLTERVHSILATLLEPGDIAIDATAGNGYDTLFLAQSVGPEGKVYGFDVQKNAIDNTQKKIDDAEFTSIVSLHQTGHENMDKVIPKKHFNQVKAITFNLGYLPGADKSCTTQTKTTLRALNTSLYLLAPNGVITLLAYPGHTQGSHETTAVLEWAKNLGNNYQVQYYQKKGTTKPSPILVVIAAQPKP